MLTQVLGDILQVVHKGGESLEIQLLRNHRLSFDESGTITEILDTQSFDAGVRCLDHRGCFILPGFIDTHVHYPQLDMIGVYSGELIDWLKDHTFPHESTIIEQEPLARRTAVDFCSELKAHGVSTAIVFASSKKEPTELLFQQFRKDGLRIISGKISMDRHAPASLLDSVEDDALAHEELIARWHQKDGRSYYALSPRFAPSCSDPLMSSLAEIQKRYNGLFLQTHFAENTDELAWVKELYPKSKDYLHVYEEFGLVHERSIFAHGIYASPSERKRLLAAGSVVSHCPTSNLFLGSGLFPYGEYMEAGLTPCLGTDVGAGTGFSLWSTMAEAVKVSKLLRQQVLPEQLFFSATCGAAEQLEMEHIGLLEPGRQADFQVIDPERKPLLARRMPQCEDERQILSALIFHCDDRCLKDFWVGGRQLTA